MDVWDAGLPPGVSGASNLIEVFGLKDEYMKVSGASIPPLFTEYVRHLPRHQTGIVVPNSSLKDLVDWRPFSEDPETIPFKRFDRATLERAFSLKPGRYDLSHSQVRQSSGPAEVDVGGPLPPIFDRPKGISGSGSDPPGSGIHSGSSCDPPSGSSGPEAGRGPPTKRSEPSSTAAEARPPRKRAKLIKLKFGGGKKR